ncbi:hypothetical protein M0208_13615 [Sphingomonas sp. SUN019]|uniref:hypothetical protein n=1 Tax=Sphingomonas sp. SUN019 TaxID=2937788 RepID=UPI00216406D2|nr:hypothetical protein [Sphingomonas sp. SUN019]UVO51490.1 hypothetical protein M0208_13615 [Sphingomonas sp. SUN019]
MSRFLSGSNLRARTLQPADELWDRRLGVRTFGYHPADGAHDSGQWRAHYIPSSYRDVFRVLRAANLSKDDIVTDLGCGLGRVVFAASWLGARRAVGVELIPWLAEAAERNRRESRLAGRDIRIVTGDAAAHSLGDTTLLYMFHAFGEGVLSRVIEGAAADRERAALGAPAPLPPLRIAYVNPVHEVVLQRSGWMRRVAELPPARQWFSNADHYATAIWESTP